MHLDMMCGVRGLETLKEGLSLSAGDAKDSPVCLEMMRGAHDKTSVYDDLG